MARPSESPRPDRHLQPRERTPAWLPRLLAPHLAVLVFWCWRHDAWACILAYHAQILLWSWRDLARAAAGWNARRFWLGIAPGIVAGPLALSLLPQITTLPLDTWLSAHGLSGTARLLMVPYFGVVHPLLEEVHWSSLRAPAKFPATGHLLFASYHALVLASLLAPPWVVACCVILVLASVMWRRLEMAAHGGLLIPVLAHAVADSSLVIAAVLGAR